MRKFLRDLFTESDNHTWDLGRVQGTIGFVVFLGLSIYAVVVKGEPFDASSWGMGFGAVVAGYGGMIWMKGNEKPMLMRKPVDTVSERVQDDALNNL